MKYFEKMLNSRKRIAKKNSSNGYEKETKSVIEWRLRHRKAVDKSKHLIGTWQLAIVKLNL